MTLDEQQKIFDMLRPEMTHGGPSLAAVLDEHDPSPDISYCAALGVLARLLDQKVNILLAVGHAGELLKLAAQYRKTDK